MNKQKTGANTQRKINHMTPSNDIVIGRATLCYYEDTQAWVTPGGELIKNKAKAQLYCERLAEILRTAA